MKLNPTDPNQFFTKIDLTLQEAIENSKPIPPWKRKLIKDLEGNRNSSTVIVDGVNDKAIVKQLPVIKRRRNLRAWLHPIRIIMLLIHWLLVLITNLFDLISDAFQEITINLTNFIRHNAQTEPSGDKPTD